MTYPCLLEVHTFCDFLVGRVSTEWGKLVPSLNHLGWVSHRWRMPYFQLLGWPMDDGTGRPFKGVGGWNWIQHGRCMYHYVSPRIFCQAKIIRMMLDAEVSEEKCVMDVGFLSRNLEERSLWSWIRGYDSSLEFMDTILGSSRHSQKTENMDPDMDLEWFGKHLDI